MQFLQPCLKGGAAEIKALLDQGICLPLFFDADCVLDRATLFVVGELTAAESTQWIGQLTSKLAVPCGRLVLLAGGGDPEEFALAVSGNPPEEDYVIYQVIDVPPGQYRVDLHAYLSGFTTPLFTRR